MTAEVAIMNQQFLVLAADSATTVTYWPKGKKQTRYFKGANKLFQLSNHHPVGLMLYSSAALLSMPWDVIVKEFRSSLGSHSFDHLPGYGPRFFEFIQGHQGLFPNDVRAAALGDSVMRAIYIEWRAIKRRAEKGDGTHAELIAKRLGELQANEPQAPLTADKVNALVASRLDAMLALLADNTGWIELESAEFLRELAEIGIRQVATNYTDYLPHTGIVIGGYGDLDFFPSFEVFDCYAFLDHDLIAVRNERLSKAVSRSEPVAIEPFATASMINTFRMGIGPDTFNSVQAATETALRKVVAAVLEKTKPEGGPWDFEALISEAIEEHGQNWFNQSYEDHYSPLAKVVASLPITDLAALAKSLIELQSLKERVTQPTESVGGAIDVAAINKHEVLFGLNVNTTSDLNSILDFYRELRR